MSDHIMATHQAYKDTPCILLLGFARTVETQEERHLFTLNLMSEQIHLVETATKDSPGHSLCYN